MKSCSLGDYAAAQVSREFSKIMISELFVFQKFVVAEVWSWALSFSRRRRQGDSVSLYVNMTAKTEQRIRQWICCIQAKLQLKCGKIMKSGVVRLIYNMRGSAKAFGSRALKMPSQR